jgi:hypothetical protein
MNKKTIGVLLCTILITTFLLPINEIEATKTKDSPTHQNISETPPLPGCIKNNNLLLKAESHTPTLQHETRSPTYDDVIVSLIQKLDEQTYLNYLQGLVSFGPRETATPACNDAGKYIYNEFKNMGLEVRYHNWQYDENLYGNNIEATIPGVKESSDEIYIICAHYDSVPGSPGADDDGSGVAAVLSTAKIMSKYKFNHTVRFVTFCGEEQGLLGSYYYVEEAYENEDNIVAVLNADMIGFATTEYDASVVRVYEDEFSEWITYFTIDTGEQYKDFINIEVIPSGYSWSSDHYRFWEFGYNAIFYTEYNFNDYYHSPDDTIENMNIDYATRVTKLILATLAQLSEPIVQEPPDKPDKPIGPTTGKPGRKYTYRTCTTDPEGDQIYYMWDWGDGTISDWQGPYNSGEPIEASHRWKEKKEYKVRVKAKDTYGAESEWSDPLTVNISRKKTSQLFQVLKIIVQKSSTLRRILC